MYFKEYLIDNIKPGSWIASEIVIVKHVSYAGGKKDESVQQIYVSHIQIFTKGPISEYYSP